jgi:hypothetical protein
MNENRFIIAAHLAHWATILDDSKADYPVSLRAKALECVDQMHRIAHEIAGTRANEIYADTKEFEISSHPDFNFSNAEPPRGS